MDSLPASSTPNTKPARNYGVTFVESSVKNNSNCKLSALKKEMFTYGNDWITNR